MASIISQKQVASVERLPQELRDLILFYISGHIVRAVCDVDHGYSGNLAWKPTIELRGGNMDLINIILSKSSTPRLLAVFNHFAWRTSWKHFERPADLIRFSLSLNWPGVHDHPLNEMVLEELEESRVDDSAVPELQNSIDSQFIGNEKIILDFGAAEYFDAFNVCVPPFDSPLEITGGFEAGAGTFLRHVKHLLIRFGDRYNYAHAWFDVQSPAWHQDLFHADGEPWTPHLGVNICSQGTVVDWILSFAWHHGYLQPIAKVELEGALQPWVRDKWEEIFRRHCREKGFVHEVDMAAITDLAAEDGQPWIHYPPQCQCKHECRRLSRGLEPQTEDGQADEGGWASEEEQGDWRWVEPDDGSVIW